MKTIWKYPLEIADEQTLQIPDGAQLLTVQSQDGAPCLWALVDPEAETKLCVLQVFGTGNPVQDEGVYLGTFQVLQERFVGHVFLKK